MLHENLFSCYENILIFIVGVRIIFVTRGLGCLRQFNRGGIDLDNRYVQLYSIMEAISKDFIGSLERIAEIGYTGVEFAMGIYGDKSAEELALDLKTIGLEPLSTHITTDLAAEHADYAAALGLKYIIDPMARLDTYEDALNFSERLNEVGRICNEKGVSLGYHNHRHEFMESKDGTLMDTLIINTDPKYVCFELDVGWATCAGCDVPAFLNKYPGRFKLIHVKECSHVAGPERIPDFSKFPVDENGRPQIPPEVIAKFREQNKWNVATGKGVIDWDIVTSVAKAQGAEYFIIERENDYLSDIFRCLEEDCMFLAKL